MEKFTFFWGGSFSQWHIRNFTTDGLTFNCAEQYMMYNKAMYFNDLETAAEILKETDPSKHKGLGRKVKNFDRDKWNEVARAVVYKGNMAKFGQNEDLKRALFATDGTTLVEASPKDTIWGIGLAASDPRAKDRSQWLGTNWLGEVLTIVRQDLMKATVIDE